MITPGPWRVTPDSFIMAGERPSIGVARVITHAAGFVENARLIAAAPELLRGLKYYLEHAELYSGYDEAEVRAAEAAVAKAEGK